LKSIQADYIYHTNEKGKSFEKDLPLFKNDITNNLEPQKPVIYSETVEKPVLKVRFCRTDHGMIF